MKGQARRCNQRAESRRSFALESGFDWVDGKIAPKAFALKPGKSVEIPTSVISNSDQGFSVGTWVKIPKRGMTGALAARMDNANAFRGWDLWMENDRVGMHIINKWSDNALKVTAKTLLQPNKWHHVFVTYDGSSKAAGVKILHRRRAPGGGGFRRQID